MLDADQQKKREWNTDEQWAFERWNPICKQAVLELIIIQGLNTSV